MKHLFPLLILLAIGAVSLGLGKKYHNNLVSFHIQGDDHDNPKFMHTVKLGSDFREYKFAKIPSFTDRDIKWFYPFTSQYGTSFGAAFQLKSHSAIELKGLCLTNQGKLLGCRISNAPLQAVIIDKPIEDGVLVVWEGLTQEHLAEFRKRFPHVDDVRGTSEASSAEPEFKLPSLSKPKERKPLFQFKKKNSGQ